MPYQVVFIPLTGKYDKDQPRILVDKYFNRGSVRQERALVDSKLVVTSRKLYQPVIFPDQSAAQIAADTFLEKLRERKPNIRRFIIELQAV